MSVFFIAEAGVNHNGDKDMAFRLIDAAVDAGADAVKFQTFSSEALACETAPKAAYQNETTDASESQLAMLKRLELPYDWHFELRDYCVERGIAFLSTPFESASLRFLVDELGLDTIKVPSGELTNGPFLLEVARSGRRIILSTGMGTLEEVREALGVLAFGLLRDARWPTLQVFRDAFESDAGNTLLRDQVTVLHCTSAYPTPIIDANLLAIVTLKKEFGLKTGFSDHTEGCIAALTAVALGAEIIEKHFTLDRALPGPDHKASLEPDDLSALIADVRNVEKALGNGIKLPQPSEVDTLAVARKSLVAVKSISAGTVLTADNISAKRPGTGVSPMHFWDYIGVPASRSIDDGAML